MLLRIARFELAHQVRQPLLWTMTLFFFLLTFAASSSNSVQIGGGLGNLFRNSPWTTIFTLTAMSLIGMFIITVFVAGAILRDFDRNTHELMFSRPVGKWDYLIGRFLGACMVSLTVFAGSVLGNLVGPYMWWVDPESVGPFQPMAYVFAVLVMALPNLVLTACLFFSLAALSRSMRFTYLGVVGVFGGYQLSGRMLSDLDNTFLASLLDPFGLGALQDITKYWTVVERNASLPPLEGVLLWNRLFWLGLGLLILLFSAWRFQASAEHRPLLRLPAFLKRKSKETPQAAPVSTLGRPVSLPRVEPKTGLSVGLQQLLHQVRIEAIGVFRSVPFMVMLAFGLFNLLGGADFFERQFGTAVYPVSRLMVEVIGNTYSFFLLIIIVLYSGELIWRERSANLDGVFDSMPVPSWVYLGGKLSALFLVCITYMVVGVLGTLGYQMWNGYTNFEPMVYAQGILVETFPFLLGAVLACFVQVASGGKFLGYLVMILYILSDDILSALNFNHNLYRFGSSPFAPFSDMNGYGHFVEPLFWFNLYWTLASVVLVGLMVLLWVRGNDTARAQRLALVRQRFQGPLTLVLPVAFAAFVAVGAYIFYNTNVLNEYVPRDVAQERQADYEKKFRQYRDVDLPRITAVKVDVDIFPDERRMEARGTYRLTNENDTPLQEFHMSLDPRVQVDTLDFGPHQVKLRDDLHGYTIYELEEPMAPGDSMDLRFDITVENPGFRNSGSDTSIVYNGTFFNNRQYFPAFGYDDGRELRNRNDRRKHDLPPAHRFPPPEDLFARRNTYIASDSDWIDFETVVSTKADQIAIAPGYLQKEWTEGDRRYFHYKMDAPILHFYSYLSAAYDVHRDQHGDVAIEIYHHPDHKYNLERMTESVKRSLDYFEEAFGPYQHRQMRIIEFPRYDSFAQAFPNTVPFSESIGFIARLDAGDEDAIDYPFYVTSHEVAHQWWAHQVIGGYVQGATMLSETFSQYSALMVMEKEYGPEKMRRFLKFELDNYLRSRSSEQVEEMPLLRVENQGYIHYRKGSVVMYSLKDYLGEDVLNQAIRSYADAVRFQEPPFSASIEFFDYLKAATPPEKQTLIADLFEHITLFENRVEEASYTAEDAGGYKVTIEAKARKVRADGQGVETEVPLNDWVDVAVFGEKEVDGESEETVLYFAKHHITDTEPTFEIVVDEEPVRAGIDPYNKLVDRNSDDNVQSVKGP